MKLHLEHSTRTCTSVYISISENKANYFDDLRWSMIQLKDFVILNNSLLLGEYFKTVVIKHF